MYYFNTLILYFFMKKLFFVFILTLFILPVFADDDGGGYDSYDVYDVYDVYDTSSYGSYSDGWSSYGYSYGSYTPSLTCPVYNQSSYKENCTVERKVDTKWCPHPVDVCKKPEVKKCPTYPKPSFKIGCSIKWNTDSEWCNYMTETCSTPEKPKTCPSHSTPTFWIGCQQTWHDDGNGCTYYTETCSNVKNPVRTCPKRTTPTFWIGCQQTWHDDPDGCTYYTETCSWNNSHNSSKNKSGNNKHIHNSDEDSYYNEYDNRNRWDNYPRVIRVQGQKKVNTVESCSSVQAPICGKKKVAIVDYSSFGTKNIEKYTQTTYNTECDLESQGAEYLYPGECRGYDSCPLYKVTAKDGCTTQWKTDSEGCQYPVQTCKNSKKVSTQKSQAPRFQWDSNYWFQPVLK